VQTHLRSAAGAPLCSGLVDCVEEVAGDCVPIVRKSIRSVLRSRSSARISSSSGSASSSQCDGRQSGGQFGGHQHRTDLLRDETTVDPSHDCATAASVLDRDGIEEVRVRNPQPRGRHFRPAIFGSAAEPSQTREAACQGPRKSGGGRHRAIQGVFARLSWGRRRTVRYRPYG
jgi:hypothetical protein